jgi:hypothetical protein
MQEKLLRCFQKTPFGSFLLVSCHNRSQEDRVMEYRKIDSWIFLYMYNVRYILFLDESCVVDRQRFFPDPDPIFYFDADPNPALN